ncbi:thioesterase II family protein [Streptomyces sp. NPDC059851]|uniref:thioesterase II family protein n=1 Tax=Streptomyces sp. NPDC059851 TaxID=3346971 RepID=UPI00365979C4
MSSSIPAAISCGGWIRRYRHVPSPRLRLVCCAHAGGSAGTFRAWPGLLPQDVELLAVQYPGRQDRFGEPCVDSMQPMAAGIAAALTPFLDRPVAFFGHSLGAAVAYEVALRLERAHGTPPAHLFVSGRSAPSRPRPSRNLHRLDDDGLLEELSALGGMDGQVLADPGLRAVVMPALRADVRIAETYRAEPGLRTGAPVTAYHGDRDASVEAADVQAWSEHTASDFASRTFAGDHFYLQERAPELVADLAARLDGVGRPGRPA